MNNPFIKFSIILKINNNNNSRRLFDNYLIKDQMFNYIIIINIQHNIESLLY